MSFLAFQILESSKSGSIVDHSSTNLIPLIWRVDVSILHRIPEIYASLDEPYPCFLVSWFTDAALNFKFGTLCYYPMFLMRRWFPRASISLSVPYIIHFIIALFILRNQYYTVPHQRRRRSSASRSVYFCEGWPKHYSPRILPWLQAFT